MTLAHPFSSPPSQPPARNRAGSSAYWTGGIAAVLIGLVAVLICTVFYVREIRELEANTREREASRLRVFTYLIAGELRATTSDLRTLANGDGLRAYLAHGQPADLDRAVHRAAFFSQQHPDYDQIRFLGPDGREVFRVNRGGKIVATEALQDQRSRAYFEHARALPADRLYLSAFDLNVEHGAIEQPLKPMLRFATPVFDEAGAPHGVYAINYAGAGMLDRLQQFVPAFSHRLRVLNAQGYWIKAARPGQEWGFMFPERKTFTLATSDPKLWQQISSVEAGQVRNTGGLFTWLRFSPAAATGGGFADDEFLVVASEISASEWSAIFASRRLSFVVVLLVLGGLMTGSMLVLRSRSRVLQERDRFFNLTRDLLCVAGFDGYFKRFNPAWQQTLGYSDAELRARPFIEFVHPEDRERTAAESAKLADGRETVSFENRYLARDGTYHWLSWNSRALVRERLIFASARDITERKTADGKIQALNHDLQLQNARLEIANKELESFSYSVSHDLRAPLRHVDGFASLLANHASGALDEKGRRYLTMISDAARRMGRLIDDLLTFSRMGRAQMTPGRIDHAQLVAAVIHEAGFDRNERLEWRIAPLPPVRADAAMLRLVWLNLIDNAVKYSARATPPRIEIGRSDEAGTADGEQVFFIRDNGVGFDMKYAANLFGVFQRLHSDAEFEGTGIGLANVRRIILRHGGRTWAQAALGAGATIYFSLPDHPA